MRRPTLKPVVRGAIAAGLLAAVVNGPALRNGFTLDDTPIVEENARAHSVAAALEAFAEPYWPPPHDAGQWRPLVILSFAADWQLTGGSTVWLHGSNVAWHSVATGLVVPLLAPLAGVAGAVAGAVLFAVHPVHVEAVANLVGRAELMAATFVLLALLAARRVRGRRAARLRSWPAEVALGVCVLLALLSKEHAVVVVALLLLDERALANPGERLPARTWVAVVALAAVWFVARGEVEAGMSFVAVAPTFFGLDTVGRLATMMPVVFHVVRLLVWPFDLSPDYHPEVVPRLESFTVAGAGGALLLIALIALACAAWRRHRAAATGLWIVGIAWLPTANLVFPSGIVLAERTLYLSSIGLALLVAAGWRGITARGGSTARIAPLAVAAVVTVFAARTVTRIPVWESTRALVVDGALSRPESYKVRQAAARVLMKTGSHARALREYSVAAELYGGDPFLLTEAGSAALALRQPRLAVRFLGAALELDSSAALARRLYDQAVEAGGASARP